MDDHTINVRIVQLSRHYRCLLALVLVAASLSSTPKTSRARDISLYGKTIESSQTIYLPIAATAWPFTAIAIFKSAPRFVPQLTINGRFDNLGNQTYDHLLIRVNLVDNRP